jgi:molybdopterin molybdotransferase
MIEAMLSVEEARERVLKTFHPLEPERVPVLKTLGRVLAEDVYAGEDIPPYANSSMDGYAVRAADTAGAGQGMPVRLRVLGEIGAGYVSERTVTPGTAIRIMTGALIPPGADAVVRVEDTAVGEVEDAAGSGPPPSWRQDRASEERWVRIFTAVPVGQYVRPVGEDVRRGESVLSQGTVVRPQEVGMLAALGHGEVAVARRPRVAILATGDEVVAIDAPLAPGKIRNANSYSNAAQVLKCGGTPLLLGIARDRVHELTEKIRAGLAQGVDLFLTSGGVSVGDFDLVKHVLAAEGEIDFWRVRMKPGKPLAFGHLRLPQRDQVFGDVPSGDVPSHEKPGFLRSAASAGDWVPVLGLPGNPVSVMVSFEMFARPAIMRMLGVTRWERPVVEATLVDEVAHKDGRRHYLRVRLEGRAGDYRATLTGGQGSGILSSMVKANALAIVPEDWDHVPAGARVQVMLLD